MNTLDQVLHELRTMRDQLLTLQEEAECNADEYAAKEMDMYAALAGGIARGYEEAHRMCCEALARVEALMGGQPGGEQ